MKHSGTRLKYPISKFDGTAAWFWKYSWIQNPANSPYEAECWASPHPGRGLGLASPENFQMPELCCFCHDTVRTATCGHEGWDKREPEGPNDLSKTVNPGSGRGILEPLSLSQCDTFCYRIAHADWMKVSEKCLHLQRFWLPCHFPGVLEFHLSCLILFS